MLPETEWGDAIVPAIERLGNEVATLKLEVVQQKKLTLELLKHVGDKGLCKGAGCKAEIYWVVHRTGPRVPYDPDGTNHFATCPDRERFRRK